MAFHIHKVVSVTTYSRCNGIFSDSIIIILKVK